MKGQKIAIIAGAVAAGVLCLAGAVLAWRAFAKAEEARRKLDASLVELQAAYKKNPFPNRANVAVITNDAARLRAWTAAIESELSAGENSDTNSLTPSAFIQQLQHTVRELDALAARTGRQVAPEGFSYGFGQYLGANGGMPKPEDVKRLHLQLRMLDAVVRELLASHINAIATVEREVFEAGLEGAPGAPAAAPMGGRHGRRAAAPAPAAPAQAAPGLSRAYPHQRFTIAFDANEFALDDALNRLSAMPLFVVVNDLSIQRAEYGLRPPKDETEEGDKAKQHGSSKTSTAKPPAQQQSAEAKTTAAALPRTQRLMSGPEIAPSLKVRLSFDVYTFGGV